jgi:hypothetical protein
MATEIVTSFWPINDSNGDPVSGAKIYVYDVGTTTPQSLYSDTGLSASVSNPIITNSAGRTTTDGGTTVGMVYKASGSYKIVVKTSADVTIYALDNIDGRVPVGSGALAIANGGTGQTTASAALSALGGVDAATVADLAADVAALVGAEASTEKTHLATGETGERPATPVEGDVRRNTTTNRWEGYNDAAAWETFFTNTEIASSGEATAGTDNTKVMTPARVAAAITAQSGMVMIGTPQDANSSATIDFEDLDSTYEAYEVRLSNVKPATDDVALWLRVGTGATPTYQSGASDYSYNVSYINTGTLADEGNNSAAQIVITGANGGGQGIGNAAGEHYSGSVKFDNPESSSDFQLFRIEAAYLNTTTALNGPVTGAGKYNSATAVTAIRFMMSSGAIASGRFTLYGLRRA